MEVGWNTIGSKSIDVDGAVEGFACFACFAVIRRADGQAGTIERKIKAECSQGIAVTGSQNVDLALAIARKDIDRAARTGTIAATPRGRHVCHATFAGTAFHRTNCHPHAEQITVDTVRGGQIDRFGDASTPLTERSHLRVATAVGIAPLVWSANDQYVLIDVDRIAQMTTRGRRSRRDLRDLLKASRNFFGTGRQHSSHANNRPEYHRARTPCLGPPCTHRRQRPQCGGRTPLRQAQEGQRRPPSWSSARRSPFGRNNPLIPFAERFSRPAAGLTGKFCPLLQIGLLGLTVGSLEGLELGLDVSLGVLT